MRKLLIVLGGLIVALIVGDRVAKLVAEAQAENHLRDTYGLTSRPDVTVRGFPFLTQVLERELERVDVAVDDVEIGGLNGIDADITARAIELQSGSAGQAELVTGRATIPYDTLVDVARNAGAPALDLDYGGEPDVVAISAELDLPTGTIDAVAYSAVRLDGSRLAVRLERIQVDGSPAPGGVDLLVGNRLDFDVQLPEVPGVGEITVDSVEVEPDGVVFTVSGRDVAVG